MAHALLHDGARRWRKVMCLTQRGFGLEVRAQKGTASSCDYIKVLNSERVNASLDIILLLFLV
eukprot:3170564-Amphidinium_carterae.1